MSNEKSSEQGAAVAKVDDLALLRSSVEIWIERAALAVLGYEGPDGTFLKDSKPAADATKPDYHLTTTARCYIALQYANRALRPESKAKVRHWVSKFRKFASGVHMDADFAEEGVRFTEKGKSAEVNTFDVAHLADHLQVADYLRRFRLDEDEPIVPAVVAPSASTVPPGAPEVPGGGADATAGQQPYDMQAAPPPQSEEGGEQIPEPAEPGNADGGAAGTQPEHGQSPPTAESGGGAAGGESPESPAGDLSVTPQPEASYLRDAVVKHLNSSIAAHTVAGTDGARYTGEVRFDRDKVDSAHFFATLHSLRALHALGEPLPEQISTIVEGARAFAVEQCYYFQRGTTHRQDSIRLAFAGCIYAIYGEHVDKDLCLGIVESLQQAQQRNGSWPATHPILRKGERPWHIASHEVALCLTWLYFQPRVPDEARPILIAMLRRYFNDAVVPTYLEASKRTLPEGAKALSGWQDDHTVGAETTVGWATAIVCHFLSNFRLVLDDWINRRVIEDLGLELTTTGYLIDDVNGRPALRWQRDYPKGKVYARLETQPEGGNTGSLVAEPQSPSGVVWPDLPPHGWTKRAPTAASLAEEIWAEWTDPLEGNGISNALAGMVLSHIYASPDEQPMSDRTAGLMPGDPGTRKTSLVKRIAAAIDWPMVAVPASLIFAKGFDMMEAQANEVFGRLNHLRRCVIFFDEFEEFFVSRASKEGGEFADASYSQRTIAAFTTSAMLPRLQDLHDKQRCLIFLATNHLGKMDSAIRRRGRFDMQIPVNHPNAKRLLEYLELLPPKAAERQGLDVRPAAEQDAIRDAAKAAIDTVVAVDEASKVRFSYLERLLKMKPADDMEQTKMHARNELLRLINDASPDDPPDIEHLT